MGAVHHGGRLDAAISEFGGNKEDWLDLSTGINPNSYPIPQIGNESWARLPDENALSNLLNAGEIHYGIPADAGLVAANGTQSILQVLPMLLLQKNVAIVSPTYEEHRYCWEQAARNVTEVKTLTEAVETAEIVVVVNPNNPTGETHQPDELLKVAEKLAEKAGFLIVDEAFADVFPELSCVPQIRENMIVLRSFGKFFGLAGLRLGFAIGTKSIMDQLQARLGPWSVSGPALEIGSRALGDVDWILASRAQIKQNSEDQVEIIKTCGLKLIGNAGLFMEFEHPKAMEVYQALLSEHILVRCFAKRKSKLRFGLCKNMEELERLAWALKKNA